MDESQLLRLFELYHKNMASTSETDELMRLLEGLPDEKLSEILEKIWESQNTKEAFFTSETRNKFLSRLHPAEEIETEVHHIDGKRRRLFVRITAAAAVIIFTISLTAVFLLHKGDANRLGVKPNITRASDVNSISPGRDKAILTLGNGRQIVLDTALNGALAQQGGVKVIKIGGQVSYNSENSTTQVLYNTISTPKGGQYQLELADGSKVWLNAASSLRFPTAFNGKDRTVELTGEGYFEVAHNPEMPFYVKAGGMEVKVIGTHLNINSYSDEPTVKTTLLQGKLSVKKKDKEVYLNPGQQAIIEEIQDNIRINYSANVEEAVAWKNGYFLFNNADIETVMRQVARWYDVEVVFENKSTGLVVGGLPRSQQLSQLLKMLEATGKVDFDLKGRVVIVKPK